VSLYGEVFWWMGVGGGAQGVLRAALDSDVMIEPVRGLLIPGMLIAKAAAKAAGGYQHCWNMGRRHLGVVLYHLLRSGFEVWHC
jgi:hypothetical protein